jgi:hypothetical protein
MTRPGIEAWTKDATDGNPRCQIDLRIQDALHNREPALNPTVGRPGLEGEAEE